MFVENITTIVQLQQIYSCDSRKTNRITSCSPWRLKKTYLKTLSCVNVQINSGPSCCPGVKQTTQGSQTPCFRPAGGVNLVKESMLQSCWLKRWWSCRQKVWHLWNRNRQQIRLTGRKSVSRSKKLSSLFSSIINWWFYKRTFIINQTISEIISSKKQISKWSTAS